jgi:transposase Tn5 family protein
VNPADILSSHIQQTIKRAKEHKVVLSVNDTTSMNLSGHEATQGLGCLSTEAGEEGYFLHDTVVFTPGGIPLGVLDAQTWAREPEEHGKKAKRKQKQIEEKESYKWLKSLQSTAKAVKEAPEVQWVSVGDREADIYELFEVARREEESLDWKLLTNRETGNFEQACEKVQWYTVRFKIEVFHKILKSGRRSEDKRLGSLDRLERCLAIDMITAWRLMYLTMQGRQTPEVPGELFFSEQEIEVLKLIKHQGKHTTNKGKSLTLAEAILIIALLGGFIKGKGRKPGVEVMWRGIRRLGDIVIGASLAKGNLFSEVLNVHQFDDG